MSRFDPPTVPSGAPVPSKQEKPIYNRKWVIILGGLLIIGLVAPKVTKTGSSTSQTTSTTTSTTTTTTTIPETLWTEILTTGIVATDLSNSICSDIDSVLKKQAKIVQRRLDATTKPSVDPFDSADYLKTIDWESFEHYDNVVAEERAVSDPVLSTSTMSIPTDEQKQAFLKDSLVTCGLDKTSAQTLADANTLDSRLGTMRSRANNLPWYPKGFDEYEDGIAYRFLKSKEFNCSYGDHCWGMYVISQSGCPSSLYVELTILDSNGSNIGFTNDTTSGLSPGQQAKMVFEDFTPGAQQARIAKISCY